MPPPSKKRKADDSPPWKSATTQTPTTFVVDGRRRSGRTNPIPFELMPATSNGSRKSSTRQTRSSAPKSEDKLAKGSSAKSNSRTPGSATKKPPANINKQTDKSTPNSSSRSASRNHRRETSPPPSGTPSRTRSVSTKTPQPKPSPRKPSSGRNAVTYGTRRTSTRTAARAATEAVTARAAKSLRDTPRARRDNDSPEFDSDGEIEVGPDYKPPRFIVKFRPPPLTITHPLHLPPKPDYPSFDAFLDSFEGRNSKEELEEAEEEAKNEAEIRQKVEEACEEGGVLHPLRNSELMPEEQPGPPRLYYHQDHLLAHVVYFQSLMEKERRRHMDQARKVAILCAQEVQKLMPKTEEQIWEELVRIRVTDYTRMFLDLRNWWAQATEVLTHNQTLSCMLQFPRQLDFWLMIPSWCRCVFVNAENGPTSCGSLE